MAIRCRAGRNVVSTDSSRLPTSSTSRGTDVTPMSMRASPAGVIVTDFVATDCRSSSRTYRGLPPHRSLSRTADDSSSGAPTTSRAASAIAAASSASTSIWRMSNDRMIESSPVGTRCPVRSVPTRNSSPSANRLAHKVSDVSSRNAMSSTMSTARRPPNTERTAPSMRLGPPAADSLGSSGTR